MVGVRRLDDRHRRVLSGRLRERTGQRGQKGPIHGRNRTCPNLARTPPTSSSSAPGWAARPPRGHSLNAAYRCCSSSAATGSRASPRTGRRMRCSGSVDIEPTTSGTTRTGEDFNRGSTPSWAARPRCTAPACRGFVSPTSRAPSTTKASPRPGRSAMPIWSPTTAPPRRSTRCTAASARIRPSRRAALPILALRCPTSPTSPTCGSVCWLPAYIRARMPWASTRGRVHSLPDLRRLPLPGPRQIGC